MIKVLTYHEIDQQQWSELVLSSPTATWFQTPEAYEFYAAVSGMQAFAYGVEEVECKVESVKCKGIENSAAAPPASSLIASSPHRLASDSAPVSTPYTLHSTPALKGVIVGYITRERNALKQFFTRRAIIYGGPLLAADISETALAELLNAVSRFKVESVKFKGKENGKADTPASRLIASSPHRLASDSDHASTPYTLHPTPIYIESRNFHDYSKWRNIFAANGFAYQPHLNYHVDTTSIELVQRSIGKHRWRYIRLSMRDGAQIVQHPTIEQVQAFYTILQNLYRTKVRTPLWSWEFFERLFHTEHARYILVELDGQIVGGTACVCLPGKAVYEWYACGLDNCRDDIRPLSVAIWGEMQYAAENGYPLFDFMGAGSPDQPYGVRDFKAEFGGELVEHGRFLCVRKPLLYWIGTMGVKFLKSKRK